MKPKHIRKLQLFLCLALPIVLAIELPAQRRREPLTPAEIDLLRDAAQDADERLKLYVKFARGRLEALSQVRSDPKITEKPAQTHDRLQDFLDVYDELNQNIDTFEGRKTDLRKALKAIIEADTEFQARLRAFKASLVNKDETASYEFLLGNALETLDSSTRDHRDLLREEEESAKHRKSTKQTKAEER